MTNLGSVPFSRYEPFVSRLQTARASLLGLRLEERGMLQPDRLAQIVPWLSQKMYTHTPLVEDYRELWKALGLSGVGNFNAIAIIESLTGELGNLAWNHLTLHDKLRFKNMEVCFGLAQRFWGRLDEYSVHFKVPRGTIVRNDAAQLDTGDDYVKLGDEQFYYYVGKARQVNDSNQTRLKEMLQERNPSFGYYSSLFNILMVRRNVHVDSTIGTRTTTSLGAFS